VLPTVADAVCGGELNDVRTQMPSRYVMLLGRRRYAADTTGRTRIHL
jgi:hypothetical protein